MAITTAAASQQVPGKASYFSLAELPAEQALFFASNKRERS